MLEFLKKEADKTLTENGAVTYRSTQSHCLDLFATVGALRRESNGEIRIMGREKQILERQRGKRLWNLSIIPWTPSTGTMPI